MTEYTDAELDRIDAEVAEHVMGWPRIIRHDAFEPAWIEPTSGLAVNAKAIPKVSRSWSAAGEVVEKMKSCLWRPTLAFHKTYLWTCCFVHDDYEQPATVLAGGTVWQEDEITPHLKANAEARTLPLAICLAALAATGHPFERSK